LLGFVWQAYPNVPNVPTLTNTGGTLYNSLDFVLSPSGNPGGNPSDITYAIAISSDNFVTTNYVQTDDTVGSTLKWQSFTNWGGTSGERITGLSPSTTYKIKVKASFAADNTTNPLDGETAFSSIATATTSSPDMTVVFSLVNSGTTVDGETTNITTTANSISYGSLVISTPYMAAHKTTVTTNAIGGYTTTLQQDGDLRAGNGDVISAVGSSNSSPSGWPGTITTGAFGYHTSDNTLCTGSSNRFYPSGTALFAGLTTSAEEVACSNGPVSSEDTTVVYKLQIGALQPAGSYQNKLTYITTAKY
jgi:hypothetical protein